MRAAGYGAGTSTQAAATKKIGDLLESEDIQAVVGAGWAEVRGPKGIAAIRRGL